MVELSILRLKEDIGNAFSHFSGVNAEEDEHGKMDYQHWLVDLDYELPTAFWVDPKLFENKKQEVQVGLCCFLGTRWKVQTTSGMEALCRDAGSMLFNVSEVPAAEARKAEGTS